MKNTLETRLGIFVALAVIAAVLILEIVGGVERFERGYRLNALFNSVQDLKEGDRVKMAGVEIGRVEKITLEETNNKVLVTMKMRSSVRVKTDSVATIKFTGLLGQNFVGLDFGSRNAPLAEPGAVLATAEQPDLSAMMAKIDNVATGVENLTKSFTGDKIDNLLGPFTDFLKANRGPLTATIANMQAVSSQIASGKGTVGKLIYDDALYVSAYNAVTNLQDTAAQIKMTVADARKVVDQVNAGQGTVGKLLHDEKLYQETTASMTNLKEILQKINQGQGSIGKIVNDQELYRNAKLTLQKLDQATEGLEDQGPLSVLGTAVSKLF
ncbi:MAG TPA: MlaD family protein [Candidatus Limnocylindrales bacterium]|jgi:phospholipid/cholesterol/gamma-HCH transport system substrate-binding protein|nr:MlaD family protein [Candidatus Limnocylindrales bacterium]